MGPALSRGVNIKTAPVGLIMAEGPEIEKICEERSFEPNSFDSAELVAGFKNQKERSRLRRVNTPKAYEYASGV